jgi:hypothetical protein
MWTDVSSGGSEGRSKSLSIPVLHIFPLIYRAYNLYTNMHSMAMAYAKKTKSLRQDEGMICSLRRVQDPG